MSVSEDERWRKLIGNGNLQLGLAMLLLLLLAGLFGPSLLGHDPLEVDFGVALVSPGLPRAGLTRRIAICTVDARPAETGLHTTGGTMSRQFIKDAFGWGFALWLIGYILGIALFAFVPPNLLGWVIMPIGIVVALWILLKKVKGDSFRYFLLLAVVWVLIAIVCDYFFLVKAFKPSDGYYKLDVYLYYALTLVLPLLVGWRKLASKK